MNAVITFIILAFVAALLLTAGTFVIAGAGAALLTAGACSAIGAALIAKGVRNA